MLQSEVHAYAVGRVVLFPFVLIQSGLPQSSYLTKRSYMVSRTLNFSDVLAF